MKIYCALARAFVCLAALLWHNALPAQVAPPLPPAPAAENTVVLSPFEVVADTRGYYSANTMSGTRLNSRLEALASSISVITKEQMADFAMLDINDIFAHETGTEGTGNYRTTAVGASGVTMVATARPSRTMDNRPLIERAFQDRVAIRWRTWAKAAHVVFPAECFAAGEAILARAASAVATAGDAEAAARVRFLQTGLTHARLSTNVPRLLTLADPAATPERGKKELAELLAFCRAHEREWFSNLNHCAWVEDLSWKLSHETKQEPEHYP